MTTLSLEAASNVRANAYRKTAWRLMPFLMLCYLCAYLDRVNVGFAKLQMMNDLALSEAVYGLGAGMFFIGYFLCEVPSNMILHRVGARVWIARIMITWGIISGLFAFVETAWQFYVLRFLLGVAEAGLAPGLLLYLTYWFPSYRRAKMTVLWFVAIPLSGMIGGPLSGWIMTAFDGVYGHKGWQWMFFLEAIPSVVLGIVVFIWLDNNVASAKWLNAEEKALIEKDLANDEASKTKMSATSVFSNGKVWVLSAIYFCFIMGLYGIGFWLPQLIKNAGVTGLLQVGMLTAIPYSVAAIGMVAFGRSSDRTGERRGHIVTAAVLGAAGLIASTQLIGNVPLSLVALSFATVGILSSLPLFWTLPTAYLGGTAAAAGIAIINSIGNLAGFASPYIVGAIKDATDSTNAGMYLLAASLIIGGVLVLVAIPKSLAR